MDTLKQIKVRGCEINNEKEFEPMVFNSLDKALREYDKSILIRTQEVSNVEPSKLKPDITIGLNRIHIELKFKLKRNDVYRLFYQAVKYSRIAKEALIIFVYDPSKELSMEDIKDLRSFEKVKVIRISK